MLQPWNAGPVEEPETAFSTVAAATATDSSIREAHSHPIPSTQTVYGRANRVAICSTLACSVTRAILP